MSPLLPSIPNPRPARSRRRAPPRPAATTGYSNSEAEEGAFWTGVCHGLRCGGMPVPRHLPATFGAEDLARPGAAPGLTSASLTDAYRPVTHDERGRALRHDAVTPEKQVVYLSALAVCGVVSDACRAAGVSRDAVYNLRNSAVGGAFALAWNAAILISRGRMADELLSRGMNGCIDRLYRNGELVAERHRHDNRLAMAVLTRLDRQAEGMGEGAAVAGAIAQEWDRFLGLVGAGGEGLEDFLAARAEAAEKPAAAEEIESAASLLARLRLFQLRDEGRAGEIETGDLDPMDMDGWTDEQWLRADISGFLDTLAEEEWPDSAHDPRADAQTNGMCRSRRLYLARHPDGGDPLNDWDDGFEVWKDEDHGCWMTNYPPPEDFDGFEEGDWTDEDYRRSLSPGEAAVADAQRAAARAMEEADLAEERAEACAARDLYFGFAGSGGDTGTVTGDSR